MTTTNINFKNNDIECYSLGRDGYIKTKGISCTHNGDIVKIEPIRANGQIGQCSIQIPFEDLLAFVKTIESDVDNVEETNEEIDEKDIAIGDTIEIEGKTYKCVKSCETEVCNNCALFSMPNGCDYVCCGELERADETDVHFELVDTEEECPEKAEDTNNTSKESTQIKVGEVGFLGGKKVRCRFSRDVRGPTCSHCVFSDREFCAEMPCIGCERDDGWDVYYEEVKE